LTGSRCEVPSLCQMLIPFSASVPISSPSDELQVWLLEEENPSARYWTLRALMGYPEEDELVRRARARIVEASPAHDILRAQWPEGYWVAPGIGYSPKYRATIWQILFLAQLGAPPIEPILCACEYVLSHARLPDGRFSAGEGSRGALLCLNGNLLRALCWFDFREDPRVQAAADALAAQITHQGLRCRFNGRTPGGGIPASMTEGLPCAWGAVKAGLGLLSVGVEHPERAAAVSQIQRLLIEHDLCEAAYPTATEPSLLWWRFGFPLGYTSDALEALTLLRWMGHEDDMRLRPAVERAWAKRDAKGRWHLEYTPEKTWGSFGSLGAPNKWVTIRALLALPPNGAA